MGGDGDSEGQEACDGLEFRSLGAARNPLRKSCSQNSRMCFTYHPLADAGIFDQIGCGSMTR